MKILVTGGAGYIGSVVVKKLVEKNFEVLVVDNLYSGKKDKIDKKAIFYNVDLLDEIKLDEIGKEHKIDAVIHFAAYKSVEESMSDAPKYSENIKVSINLLNFMVKYKVPKIIFSSSASVYGNLQESRAFKEDDPVLPVNYYGYTKLAIEEIIRWYFKIHNISYINLRYFNVAGDGGLNYVDLESKNIFPIIMQAVCGKMDFVTVFGDDYDTKDGTCIRDYIHIEDLADAHVLAIFSAYNGNLNLGSETGFSVKEVIQRFLEISPTKFKYEYGKRRAGDPAFVLADASLAQKHLMWTCKKSLDDMIISTIKAYETFAQTLFF